MIAKDNSREENPYFVKEEVKLNNQKSENLVKIWTDFNNSVNPLINLWGDSSTSSTFAQIYDINKSKSTLSKPQDNSVKLHDFCQIDKAGLAFAFIDHKDCYILDPREKIL